MRPTPNVRKYLANIPFQDPPWTLIFDIGTRSVCLRARRSHNPKRMTATKLPPPTQTHDTVSSPTSEPRGLRHIRVGGVAVIKCLRPRRERIERPSAEPYLRQHRSPIINDLKSPVSTRREGRTLGDSLEAKLPPPIRHIEIICEYIGTLLSNGNCWTGTDKSKLMSMSRSQPNRPNRFGLPSPAPEPGFHPPLSGDVSTVPNVQLPTEQRPISLGSNPVCL